MHMCSGTAALRSSGLGVEAGPCAWSLNTLPGQTQALGTSVVQDAISI